MQHGFTTHEDATMRLNGGDWSSNMDQLAREYEKLRKVMPERQDTGQDVGDEDEEEDEDRDERE